MDIAAVTRNPPVVAAPVDAIPLEKAPGNREIIQAVKALNGTELLGEHNELVFQRDSQTRRMVLRVVNRKTKEVISQLPPEYVLSLAADAKQSGG